MLDFNDPRLITTHQRTCNGALATHVGDSDPEQGLIIALPIMPNS